jgi:hypothetical protein
VIKKEIKKLITKFGYELKKIEKKEESHFLGCSQPYLENPEAGPVNWEEKEKRVKEDGPFEWPNMIALSQTVVSVLGNAKRILEVGSGTGCFAWHAAMNKSRFIVASELDDKAREWAMENRSAENVEYVSQWLNEFEADSFDLVVAIELIEHIKDYSTFLMDLSRVAPRAIITTPNKNRDEQSGKVSPPKYYQHVREWTAGEFYWVLKVFYKDVELYAMPNVNMPYCVPINITSRMTPLVAVCKTPYD